MSKRKRSEQKKEFDDAVFAFVLQSLRSGVGSAVKKLKKKTRSTYWRTVRNSRRRQDGDNSGKTVWYGVGSMCKWFKSIRLFYKKNIFLKKSDWSLRVWFSKFDFLTLEENRKTILLF